MTLRACTFPGCGGIAYQGNRCPRHARPQSSEPRRATTTARGYGSQHERERKRWQPLVEAGAVSCSRCNQPILPGEVWDLDHADNRFGYRGPSHARCNRGNRGLR